MLVWVVVMNVFCVCVCIYFWLVLVCFSLFLFMCVCVCVYVIYKMLRFTPWPCYLLGGGRRGGITFELTDASTFFFFNSKHDYFSMTMALPKLGGRGNTHDSYLFFKTRHNR